MDWKINHQSLFKRDKLNFVKIWWLKTDKVILGLVLFLILFGLFMNFTSSPSIAKRIEVSQLFFFKKHLIFLCGSIFLLVFFSYLKVNHIKLMAPFLFFAIILMLILTLMFGSEIKGSKRWLSLFGFTLQPSEFAKVIFVIFNAFLLDKLSHTKFYFKYIVSSISCLLLVSLLIRQPDFGMSFLVILLWSAQLFLCGLSWIAIFAISILGIFGMISAYIFLPHVRGRVDKFFDIGDDYQVDRSIDAYINGGFFGTGPGNGLVKKHIPDSHSDFIFSVVAEEFGVIISSIFIFIFIYLITRVVRKNDVKKGCFAYLTVSGLVIQFATQVIINIGVGLAILPTKGITLPFISYGGSSLIAMSMSFGIILAMTRKRYGSTLRDKDLLMAGERD
ncbi:MAG: cell division protein FtsW [Rickettsiales bacterium]|jgi:cell division protein FtsW